MKIFIYFLFVCEVSYGSCFVAKENSKIVKQMGDCDKRHSPFSSFKVALAVIGFDSGILTTPTEPLVEFKGEIEKIHSEYWQDSTSPYRIIHEMNHNPSTWMRFSVVWYSLFIKDQLGQENFEEYVNRFDYGNKQANGIKGDYGVSWIFSTIEISPLEQLSFIEKLNQKLLPVSIEAQEKTIEIMRREDVFMDGWKLYGKTGGSVAQGWFVGWVQKNDRVITFVQYIEQLDGALLGGGATAKELAINNLIPLM